MGMFDSVMVPCLCGTELEFQSKAGECCLEKYRIGDAPTVILADLIGDQQTCPQCGKIILLEGHVELIVRIELPSEKSD